MQNTMIQCACPQPTGMSERQLRTAKHLADDTTPIASIAQEKGFKILDLLGGLYSLQCNVFSCCVL